MADLSAGVCVFVGGRLEDQAAALSRLLFTVGASRLPQLPQERSVFSSNTLCVYTPPPTLLSSDSQFAALRADLESDAQDLEAESWSLAVDQEHVKKLCKDMVKRQDVIYGEGRPLPSFPVSSVASSSCFITATYP